jgi:cytochrome d ubiquinol oxidase subunit II
VLLLPIPVATAVLFWVIYRSLQLPTKLAQGNEYGACAPRRNFTARFAAGVPRPGPQPVSVLIDRITIWQAAIRNPWHHFGRAAVVLPMIIGWPRCLLTACSGRKAPL